MVRVPFQQALDEVLHGDCTGHFGWVLTTDEKYAVTGFWIGCDGVQGFSGNRLADTNVSMPGYLASSWDIHC